MAEDEARTLACLAVVKIKLRAESERVPSTRSAGRHGPWVPGMLPSLHPQNQCLCLHCQEWGSPASQEAEADHPDLTVTVELGRFGVLSGSWGW